MKHFTALLDRPAAKKSGKFLAGLLAGGDRSAKPSLLSSRLDKPPTS